MTDKPPQLSKDEEAKIQWFLSGIDADEEFAFDGERGISANGVVAEIRNGSDKGRKWLQALMNLNN